VIATLWRFLVRADAVDAFERAYGPRGEWAQLFARAYGYAGTELLRLDAEPATYPTIDRWLSAADHDAARTALAEDHAALDRRREAYTSEEAWLGLHTSIG
jgi:heme-degrading monooxygenase HmoA